MTKSIKTLTIAALMTGAAATAHASNLAVSENNPDINAMPEQIVDAAPVGSAIIDPSTTYDVNGQPLIKQRGLATEDFEVVDGENSFDPFVTYDINGNPLPSGS